MRTRLVAMAAAGLSLTVILTACGSTTATSANSPSSAPSAPASATGEGRAADITFAQLMIPHHQQAIEMADLAVKYGLSADVRELATQIKGAQDPEIAQMTQWLQDWGAPLSMPGGTDGMDGMDGMDMGGMSAAGMMSDQEMAALTSVRGATFDRMWLQMMITHHQGAITMAQQVLATTSDPQVMTLANAIIDAQTAELDTMQQLLT
jgi:uncharacterized protein (DUF305 family)